jgi:hypothetical protein
MATTSVGAIANPAGVAPPSWDSVSGNRTFQGFIAEYVASAAITAGQVVYLNTDVKATKAATNTVRESCIGVAIEDAAAGTVVKVCHLGVATVKSESNVGAGVLLMRSGSTAGSVDTATSTADDAEGGFIGVSITAESGGELYAFISPSFQRYNET